MRATGRDLALVGGFVLVAGTILVAALLWIAGAHVFERVDRYTVLFQRSVSGLAPGAMVDFQGVAVGRVADIRLTGDVPPQVAVLIDVHPGTPVQGDTTAALTGSLVTGIKLIQLQGGTAEAGRLPPGSTIPGDARSLEQFRDRAEEIATRALSILQRLDEQVFTPANNEKLSRFVVDLGSVAENLGAISTGFREEETGRSLGKLIKQVQKAVVRIDDLLADVDDAKGEVLGQLTGAVRNADEAVREVRGLVLTLREQLTATGGSLATLLADLAVVTQRLEETVDLIQSDPSLLLRGREVERR